MKGKTVWNNNDASRRMYGSNDVTHVARFSDNESIKLGQSLAVSDSIEFGTAAMMDVVVKLSMHAFRVFFYLSYVGSA